MTTRKRRIDTASLFHEGSSIANCGGKSLTRALNPSDGPECADCGDVVKYEACFVDDGGHPYCENCAPKDGYYLVPYHPKDDEWPEEEKADDCELQDDDDDDEAEREEREEERRVKEYKTRLAKIVGGKTLSCENGFDDICVGCTDIVVYDLCYRIFRPICVACADRLIKQGRTGPDYCCGKYMRIRADIKTRQREKSPKRKSKK